MCDVDCWDETRDARAYPGPGPVVAHPPCGPWGRLAHLCRRSHEKHLALVAVAQVRAYGGVLEHPQGSGLFAAAGLPRPGKLPDAWGGYSIEVAQCDWGHVARKRTLLYLVGVPRSALESRPAREPTHWVSGGRGSRNIRGPVPPGIKICSAQQRRRTPPDFAAYLVRLARAAGEARRAA
jgi:hypothetical protein